MSGEVDTQSGGQEMDPLSIGRVRTLHEVVYEKLRDAIIRGHLEPGSRLLERDLSEKLQVSRTPIREALKKLELEGLITSHPYKGVIVSTFSPAEIAEIYIVRSVLDGLAARLCVPNITEDMLNNLCALIDDFREAMERNDLTTMVRTNTEFHWVITRHAKNRKLEEILDALRAHTSLIRFTSLSVPGRPPQTLEEHRAILKALEERDPVAAERASIRHVENACAVALSR